MSLQHAAKHLEKHGRNGDTMLVHMSKGEVKSLNDIAMAGGGHLTINPHTGLMEAGFLKRMLPMVIGAGLAATGVGAPMAALMVGGGYTAATGSLKKGLMAGLGAYGGAGLSGSLMQAGAPSVAPEAIASQAPAPVVDVVPTPVAQPPAVPTGSPMGGIKVATELPAGSISAAAPVDMTAPAPVVEAPVARTEVAPTQLAPAPATNAQTLRAQQNVLSGSDSLTSAPVTEVAAAPAPAPAPVENGMIAEPSSKMTLKPPKGDVFGTKFGLQDKYINPDVTATQPVVSAAAPATSPLENMTTAQRFEALKKGATFDNLVNYAKENPLQAASMAVTAFTPDAKAREKKPGDSDPGQQYTYEANAVNPTPTSDPYGTERKYYNQRYVARAGGGPVESMSNANAIGQNTGYPMADIKKGAYATPYQTPISRNVITDAGDTEVNPMTGEMGNFARGGLSAAAYNLGGYSDGGRLLRGPGDGVSDSIPAVIGKKQPARLADGEFVVPARIVSELGNGSTEAGARKLYAMMDRIQKARGKTVGKGKVAKNSRSEKYLPA